MLVGTGSYCPTHQAQADERRAAMRQQTHKRYNRQRDESDKFYSTVVWRRFRDHYLIMHPLCVDCEEEGDIEPAVVVDHIKPFKERPDLGLDEDNVRGLCRRHDNKRRHDRTGRD